MQTEKQKMLAGELYNAADAQLQADQAAAAEWMMRYNATGAQPFAQRHAWLVERLAEVGAGAVIRPPFHCDYGYDIRLSAGVFLNFNCVILDICEVHIGDGTQVGPAVQFYAADHPRDAAGRARGGVWSADPRRAQWLDRRRGDHPAGCHHRRRCAVWRRRGGHARCASRRDRSGQSCARARTPACCR
ncbi:hypothetical protein MML47_21280 [Xanthomonas oryzae]|nr:maltose acetyltransferase domain-containing protein [Xanthomonas oryzae]UNE62628.1 hypothetical protein MML47_21280 [Xanthomonas oryzae]